jgi:Putative adhesin
MRNRFTAQSLTFATFLPCLAILAVLSVSQVVGQSPQTVSKRFPAGKNVHVELKNIFGTIVVESWERDEIRMSATMESPKAQVVPRQVDQTLVIDVMGDNRGRGDIGAVNFKLQIPATSSVNVETKRGNIEVHNLRGGSVRAHVSTEGDITLTNINASQVIAQNTIGDIIFDGEFSRGGTYEFKSTKGNISIRIPGDSAFRLVVASPAKKIVFGEFWNNNFKTQDGRRYVGDVGDGRSSVSVTNFSGSIQFIRR